MVSLKFSLSFLLILGLGLSCSPKTSEELVITKPDSEIPKTKTEDVDKPLTTCTTLSQLTPAVRSEVEDAFTLYRDQIRFEKFDNALALWKKAYYAAPGANGKVTYHFDDGIKIYNHLFQQTTDTKRKSGIVDTIMAIYSKRIECFADDGTVLAHRAFDSYYKYSEYVDKNKTFDDFKEVVKRKGLMSDYFIVNPFSKLLYDKVVEGSIDTSEAKKLTLQVFDIIDYGLKNCKDKYCEAWDIINEYSPALLAGLEGIRGYYDCQYYVNKYYKQFENDSTNCDNVTEVYFKLIWASCSQTDAKFIRIKKAKERECYVAPTPPGPLKLAYGALEEGQFKESIDYFEQFISETNDRENKAEKLLIIAKIYYAHIRNFPMAKKYALSAAEYKANWGDPYLLIGKLYASSGPLCGPGRGWDSQVVTWPAIDKFEYARRIDSKVASEATKLINQYMKYMPSIEDIFQRQLKEGSSFRVACWIQENTTIRAARG